MATGYTHDVMEGKVQDFPTFALQCARAFGALVEMRDSDPSTPIPDEFKPSDRHAKALETSKSELARLKAMTPAEKAEAYGKARAAFQCERNATRQKNDAVRSRYDDMLAKVRAWKVPTPNHQGLREFMEKQLVDSIKFDCTQSPDWPKPIDDIDEWHNRLIESAAWSVEYHTRELATEEKRCRERSDWVRDLKASLRPNYTGAPDPVAAPATPECPSTARVV